MRPISPPSRVTDAVYVLSGYATVLSATCAPILIACTAFSGTDSSILSGSSLTSVNSALPGATHSPGAIIFSEITPSNGARTRPSLTDFAIMSVRACAAETCCNAAVHWVIWRSYSLCVIAPFSSSDLVRAHS